MSPSPPHSIPYDPAEKAAVEHVEKVDLDEYTVAAAYNGQDLRKSRFDELSIPRTIWVFRRSVLVVLAVYTGYMCEGFEVSRSCFV